MQHENLMKKHGLTKAQIDNGIRALSRGMRFITDPLVMYAITELLACGDIEKPDET